MTHPMQSSLLLAGILTLLSATASAGQESEAFASVPFQDVTTEVGVDFRHENGMTGRYRFAEMMGSGVAVFDVDGDGRLDLYFVQGGPLEAGAPGLRPTDRLYRNTTDPAGAMAFTDVTARAGLESTDGYGMGVATGDLDLDGDVDLVLTGYGTTQLLRNRGDGTFEDDSSGSGVEDSGWSVSASIQDFDGDGWPDIWIAHYVVSSLAHHVVCRDVTGGLDYCGPRTYSSAIDRVLRGRGDGTFEDVTGAWVGDTPAGSGLGVVSLDLDGEGPLEVYVANDLTPNHLWHRTPAGEWKETAVGAGCSSSGEGELEASMGVIAEDLDGDGDEDLFLTHLDRQTNTFYRNAGEGFFLDDSLSSGLGNPSWPFTGFGIAPIDVDLDGRLDLVIANGAVRIRRELVDAGDPFPLHERNLVFRGLGDGRFVDVSGSSGAAFEISEVSRGLAHGDLDRDGDEDLVLANNHGPARVLRNMIGQDSAWLAVRATTGTPPRDALGARLTLTRNGKPLLSHRIRTDGSYASASSPEVVFGLGAGADARHLRLQIEWPGGRTEVLPVESLRTRLELHDDGGPSTR